MFYHPITVIVLRLVFAVPLLFTMSLLAGKLQRISRRHLSLFVLLGFFEPFLYFLGECYGVNMISPTLASIIISLIPLLAPIPARYLFREKLSLANVVGLFISVAGVFLVVVGEGDSKPVALAGVLLMLLAAVSAVCHSVFVRKLSENCQTSVKQNIIWQCIFISEIFKSGSPLMKNILVIITSVLKKSSGYWNVFLI